MVDFYILIKETTVYDVPDYARKSHPILNRFAYSIFCNWIRFCVKTQGSFKLSSSYNLNHLH